MKKIASKLLFLSVIVAGVTFFGNNAFAACTNQVVGKEFKDTITVTRGDTATFKTQFRYNSVSDCTGKVIPGTFYDLKFAYTAHTTDSWKEISIPDSAVTLKFNEWTEISISVPIKTFFKDYLYDIRFQENNEVPDLDGPKKLYWVDSAVFSKISLKNNNAITDSSAQLIGSVTYPSEVYAVSSRNVPAQDIVARVYEFDTEKLVYEKSIIPSNSALKYNTPVNLEFTADGLSPEKKYKIVFLDKKRTSTDSSGFVSFTTIEKTNTSSPTSPTQQNTAPIFTLTDKGKTWEFYEKNAITINGKKFYPDLYEHSDLTDSGQWMVQAATAVFGPKPNHESTEFLDTLLPSYEVKFRKRGSSAYLGSASRVDGGSRKAFETKGDVYMEEFSAGEKGLLINPGVYTVDFVYNGKAYFSEDICLESSKSPKGNIIGNVVCGDGANSATLISGSAPDTPTAPNVPTSGNAIGSNGIKVSFTVTKAKLITDDKDSDGKDISPYVSITGTMSYDKNLSGADLAGKVGAIEFSLFNNGGSSAGKATGSLSNTLSNPKSFTVSAEIPNINPDNGPYTFKVKDTDSGASIPTEFFIEQSETISSGINQSAAWYAATSPTTTDGTTVVFTEPTFTKIDNTSIKVNTKVNYKNTAKSGKVASPGVELRLYTVDSNGKQTLNKQQPVPGLTPSYNQEYQFSATVDSLNSANKYAIQFVDPKNGNATSTARIIESKNGAFVESEEKPVDTTQTSTNTNSNSNLPTQEDGSGLAKLKNLTSFNSIPEIVTAFVDNIVIPIAVPFLALSIIYTGFLFVKARGKPDELTKAKQALKWTLIGGAIILGAYVIATALQGTIADITGIK